MNRGTTSELASLFDRLPVALYRTTPAGRVIAANPALAKLLGMDSVTQILEDEDFANRVYASSEERELWRQTIESVGEASYEAQLTRPDGTTIWVQDTGHTVYGSAGEVLFYEGALTDITDRKLVEASRTRLFAILDTVPDTVMVARPDRTVVYGNQSYRRLLGLSAEGDAGEFDYERFVVEAKELRAEVAAALRSDESWSGEFVMRDASRREIPVWAVIRGHRNHQGRIEFVSVIARDMTEQHHSAIQLQNLMRAKDEFVATVSHELRTPLTAVVGMAGELAGNFQAFSDSERHEVVKLVAEQATDMAGIIDDLLVAAQASSGSVTIVREPTGVRAQIEAAVRGLVEGRVLVEPGPELMVDADPRRVRQILRNLLTNAKRYGGPTIRVCTHAEAGVVVVEVSDDGAGVPLEDQGRIFEPYQRSIDSLQAESVGLGLSVSRQLAECMGGDLSYRHQDGWSIFRLTLPAAG